jgi:hypothetical protein
VALGQVRPPVLPRRRKRLQDRRLGFPERGSPHEFVLA